VTTESTPVERFSEPSLRNRKLGGEPSNNDCSGKVIRGGVATVDRRDLRKNTYSKMVKTVQGINGVHPAPKNRGGWRKIVATLSIKPAADGKVCPRGKGKTNGLGAAH